MRQRALLPHGVGEQGLAGVVGGMTAMSGGWQSDAFRFGLAIGMKILMLVGILK